MEKMTVDDFVQTRILPEYHPLVAHLRAFMQEYAPGVKEIFSYDMPCYQANHILAYLTPNQQGITFSFVNGVLFEDQYGLLRGKAKWARYVKLTQIADINPDALRYYIAQALTFDSE